MNVLTALADIALIAGVVLVVILAAVYPALRWRDR